MARERAEPSKSITGWRFQLKPYVYHLSQRVPASKVKVEHIKCPKPPPIDGCFWAFRNTVLFCDPTSTVNPNSTAEFGQSVGGGFCPESGGFRSQDSRNRCSGKERRSPRVSGLPNRRNTVFLTQTLHGTAIYAYVDPSNHPNVGIYGIHGVSG